MSYLNHNPLESTPFVSVEIKSTKTKGGAWFKLYWTKNAGMYGVQCHFEGNDHSIEEGYFHGKTGGCGYSKEASAINDCLKQIMKVFPNCHHTANDIFYKYKTGGNHYTMSRAALKKEIKARK